jgi:hypothetical protein
MKCLQSSLKYLGNNLTEIVDEFPNLANPTVSIYLPNLLLREGHDIVETRRRHRLAAQRRCPTPNAKGDQRAPTDLGRNSR